jgi:serine/threonine protein kinase
MAAANANATPENFFLTEYGEAQRYTIKEVIGKGSYGVVCSAIDNNSGTSSALDERERELCVPQRKRVSGPGVSPESLCHMLT